MLPPKVFRDVCLGVGILCLSAGLFTGCAVVSVDVDRRDDASRKRELIAAKALKDEDGASVWLSKAGNRKVSETERLNALLQAARLTALKSAGTTGWEINRVATRQVVDRMKKTDFAPINLEGENGLRRLELIPAGGEWLDPRVAKELILASGIEIKGLLSRSVQNGFGEPYVAVIAPEAEFLKGQPGIPPLGIAMAVTAVIRFEKGVAKLGFRRTVVHDRFRLPDGEVRLAADFSAPLAVEISRGRNRALDLNALLFTKRNMSNMGLFQLEPYDPNKIPVVFVHGLLSRPEAWTQVANGLLADPVVRERYQMWFYIYPTGLPVWASTAKLRMELDRYREAVDPEQQNQKLDELVVVGHSMGGLITSLMLREGGLKLWSQFSDVEPDDLVLEPEARKILDEVVFYPPRKDIGRAIFVSTPHRGSDLAVNGFADFFAGLIRLPSNALSRDRGQIIGAMRSDMRSLFVAPANSIRFLKAESPLLLSILNLPMAKPVPYHSIMGDRGRGDTPESSDGVVEYWSSRLDGAKSEKIVPSGHGANEHPDGVEEIRRILRASAE